MNLSQDLRCLFFLYKAGIGDFRIRNPVALIISGNPKQLILKKGIVPVLLALSIPEHSAKQGCDILIRYSSCICERKSVF